MTQPASQTSPRLLVDVGNTLTKWGWLPAGNLSKIIYLGDCGKLLSEANKAQALHQMARDKGIDLLSASAVYGACVAGEERRRSLANTLQHLNTPPVQWVTSPVHAAALRNDYATPHTLGTDRYLACLGLANQLVRTHSATTLPPAALLATFGTATTVDALRWDSAEQRYVFMGGIIIAGLAMALRSLNLHTAQLPDLSDSVLSKAKNTVQHPAQHNAGHHAHDAAAPTIPSTTDQALWHGACWAQVGAVKRMAHQLQPDSADTCLAVYVAGGAAQAIWPSLLQSLPQSQMIDHPVLSGLACLE